MSKQTLRVAAFALAALACHKNITSEERLERATQGLESRTPLEAAELITMRCDSSDTVSRARNENLGESERLAAYMGLHAVLRDRVAAFDRALARNPDLEFQNDSREVAAARQTCVQQLAEVRFEFERFTRELIDVPTVQEVKGGATVARLDFQALRQAIEALEAEDSETLFNKLAVAEKKIDVKADSRRKNRN